MRYRNFLLASILMFLARGVSADSLDVVKGDSNVAPVRDAINRRKRVLEQLEPRRQP